MGLFDMIQAAMPAVAGARASYLDSQDAEQDKQKALARQSLLDQMKQKMDESTMAENAARGRYFDKIGNAREEATSEWDKPVDTESEGLVQHNKHTGAVRRVSLDGSDGGSAPGTLGVSDTGGPPMAGGNATLGVSDTGSPAQPPTSPLHLVRKAMTPPAYDQITAADGTVYLRNSRDPKDIQPAMINGKPIRAHVPRDPSEAPAMNPHTREQLANSVADRAVEAVGGDPIEAMSWMEKPGEQSTAAAAGMTRAHYYAAAARYKRRQAREQRAELQSQDLHGNGGPPPGVTAPIPPAPSGGGRGGAPRPPVAATGDGNSGIPVTALGDNEKAAIAMQRIRNSGGKITPQQALASPALSDGAKAIIRKTYNLPDDDEE